MSQEFEKLVLEKLNSFDGRFDKIEKTLDEHTEKFERVDKVLSEQSKKIAKNTEEIEGLIEVVKYHTNVITKSEYEFSKKIDTLFDAYNLLNNKINLDKVTGRMLESKIFQHHVRISALEDAK